jgi:hypothetical protein
VVNGVFTRAFERGSVTVDTVVGAAQVCSTESGCFSTT